MKANDDSGMSPLRESAIQLHELYTELKAAGFSRSESMELVARTMATMAGDQSNKDD